MQAVKNFVSPSFNQGAKEKDRLLLSFDLSLVNITIRGKGRGERSKELRSQYLEEGSVSFE